MKYIYILIVFSFTQVLFSQKLCNSSDEESLEDLNSITKCSITPTESKKNKKTTVLKVKVSASKKRFLKKRMNKTSLQAIGVSEERARQKAKKLIALTSILSAKEIKSAKKFMNVDDIPVFNKCQNLKDNESRLSCFNQKMGEHINKFFYYPVDALQKEIQGKIWVRFIIDSNGNIGNIKTLGSASVDTKQLEEVAKYVVAKLPVFQPALKNGKPVSVKYGFPIDFSLEQ